MKKLKLKFYLFVAETLVQVSVAKVNQIRKNPNKTLKDCEKEGALVSNILRLKNLIQEIREEQGLELI